MYLEIQYNALNLICNIEMNINIITEIQYTIPELVFQSHINKQNVTYDVEEDKKYHFTLLKTSKKKQTFFKSYEISVNLIVLFNQ